MSERTAGESYPDPEYLSPGYIDVLYISDVGGQNDCIENEHVRDKGLSHVSHQQGDAQFKLRNTKSTTSGYSIDSYAPERWIPIHPAANDFDHKHSAGNAVKKRKREDSDRVEELKDNHKASWNAFQYYLDQCFPVKISGVSSFRDTTPKQLKEDNECGNKTYGVLPCPVACFPSAMLDTTVTVQCAFFGRSSTENNEVSNSPKELDRAISFCKRDSNTNSPTFMGQEDQITSEMTLKEVLSWNRTNNLGDVMGDSADETKVPSMAVCVAQEAICTVSYPSDTTDSHQSNAQIRVQLDGRVSQDHTTSLESAPALSQLAAMLRLPSYLLLSPNESKTLAIHDINFWHAPQNCCTNAHYDDRDNILLVTEGVKTVELCPPGCIEASPIYCEHANHPSLLRRTQNGETNYQSKQNILELKRQRTHIVSISAGEGLYIPSGWWHRVESDRVCTAVNVWFDYIRANVPNHMTKFRWRQMKRKYYESHETELAASFLQQLRCEQKMSDTTIDAIGCTKAYPTIDINDWKQLREMAFETELVNVEAFGELFIKCWEKYTSHATEKLEAQSAINNLEDLEIQIDMFAKFMNAFFLRISLDQPQQLQGLVHLWIKIPLPQRQQLRAVSFTHLIKHLHPSSCYIITQAWERHASSSYKNDSTNTDTQAEVEKSYKHFFNLFNDDNTEKSIRLHLLDGVEIFRRALCSSIAFSK
jgi:hypothetical protein